MVGISLALQLARLMPDETSICLVEGFPFPKVSADGRPEYHPSFDARSTALSYSTRLIYEQMQVWEDLQQWLCPIESIHVSSRGRFGSTLWLAGSGLRGGKGLAGEPPDPGALPTGSGRSSQPSQGSECLPFR